MPIIVAAFFLFALLLAVSGVAKMWDPSATHSALAGADLPSGHSAVRVVGLFEVTVAVAAVVVAGVGGGLLLAGTYMALTVVALVHRRRGADCGCFGARSTPVTGLHLTVNIVAAASGVLAAVTAVPSLPTVFAGQPLLGVPFVTALTVGVVLLRLLLVALPDLLGVVAREKPS